MFMKLLWILVLYTRSEVAILYGSKNTDPEVLDAGKYRQTIDLPDPDLVQIALGVRSSGNDFIFQDDGWLNPTNSYEPWRAGTSGPKIYAKLENCLCL